MKLVSAKIIRVLICMVALSKGEQSGDFWKERRNWKRSRTWQTALE